VGATVQSRVGLGSLITHSHGRHSLPGSHGHSQIHQGLFWNLGFCILTPWQGRQIPTEAPMCHHTARLQPRSPELLMASCPLHGLQPVFWPVGSPWGISGQRAPVPPPRFPSVAPALPHLPHQNHFLPCLGCTVVLRALCPPPHTVRRLLWKIPREEDALGGSGPVAAPPDATLPFSQ
jgi:hypothetical protein